jgi:hypothetical protein
MRVLFSLFPFFVGRGDSLSASLTIGGNVITINGVEVQL